MSRPPAMESVAGWAKGAISPSLILQASGTQAKGFPEKLNLICVWCYRCYRYLKSSQSDNLSKTNAIFKTDLFFIPWNPSYCNVFMD